MFALLPISALAQDNGQTQTQPGQGRPGMEQRRRNRQRMAFLAQKLNLTDDQRQQFQKLHQQAAQQARAIHNDSSLTDEQKQAKMQELHKQTRGQMMAALTPEQQEKLKQLWQERRKHQEDKEKGTGGKTQSSNKKPSADDDDPFAGMTSDDGGQGTSTK